MTLKNSFIELYTGVKSCSGGCIHCDFSYKDGIVDNSTLNKEQEDIFLKVQYILGKNKGIKNLLNIIEPFYESKLTDLPFERNFRMEKIIIDLGNKLLFNKNSLLNKDNNNNDNNNASILVSHLSNILKNYKGNIPTIGLAQHLTENIFNKSLDNNFLNQKIIDTIEDFIVDVYKILQDENSLIKSKNLNTSFATNGMDKDYILAMRDEEIYTLLQRMIYDITFKLDTSTGGIGFRKDEILRNKFKTGSLFFSENYTNSNGILSFDYRILSRKHPNMKEIKTIEKLDMFYLSIHADKVQIDHQTYNINVPEFWFNFDEFNILLNKSKSADKLYLNMLYELEKRGINVNYKYGKVEKILKKRIKIGKL